MDEVLAAARGVDWAKLADRRLCDACLGRLFGKLGHGHTNEARGRAVREIAAVAPGPCWLCEGLTSRYDDFARLVAAKLASWEHDTFLIGSKVDPEVQAREESLWSELLLAHPEAVKSEVNREVGKRVCDLTSKEPDLENPDTGSLIKKYMKTMDGVDGEYRTRLFHAIRDLTADAYGGWRQVTNIQAGGGLYAQRIVTRRYYDIEQAKRMALQAAGLDESDVH